MTYNELWRQLAHIYDDGEAKAIARMVYEVRFGLSPSDLFIGKDTQLSTDDQKLLEEITQRLMTGEPVQYAIGLAEFGGRTFHVEPGVLIPRPETYELCQWVTERHHARILDIGTGSGCIACTLAADMPNAQVTAWDISEEALRTAAANAESLGVTVRFEKRDILNVTPPSSLPPRNSLAPSSLPPRNEFDAIVSNPPYICEKEKDAMERNVLDYEPALALFVPDDSPLLFYKAIAGMAKVALRPQGLLAVEVNRAFAKDVATLFENRGFIDVNVYEDQSNNPRFVFATA